MDTLDSDSLASSASTKTGEVHIVYLAGPGSRSQREAMRERIREAAHQVVDVSDAAERSAFTLQIADVGRTAPPQGKLFEYDHLPVA